MRKLTHEEQVEAIAKVNPDVEVLGRIINNETHVLCRCRICGHKWEPTPHNLKRRYGCPRCAGNVKLTHNEQVKTIAKVNPNISILGTITNDSTKVQCRCKICNHKWNSKPSDLKQGKGCPKCATKRANLKNTLAHKEQVAAIKEVNPDIEVLGEITGSKKKVLCRCKICNHEWNPTPSDLKQGKGCPKCANCGFLSHKQGELYILVDDLEVPTMMKVGVSIDAEKRKDRILRSARKAGAGIPDLYVVKTWSGTTERMQAFEKAIHQALSQYKINFLVKFDGCNEFFYYRPEVFDEVEKLLT